MENKPQSERAHELAEFVRGYAISNATSFGDYVKPRYKDSSWQYAYEHLADEIESLAKPEQNTDAHELAELLRMYLNDSYDLEGEMKHRGYIGDDKLYSYDDLVCILIDKIESIGEQDGLPYPLDKDGVPIKFGDTIYYCGIRNKVVGFKYYDECEYPHEGVLVDCRDEDGMYNAHFAQYFTHKPPRTLNDILQDVPSNSFFGVQTCETVNNLIQEAYDLGLSDGAKKNE